VGTRLYVRGPHQDHAFRARAVARVYVIQCSKSTYSTRTNLWPQLEAVTVVGLGLKNICQIVLSENITHHNECEDGIGCHII
jgi:hypothetical protein